MRCRDCSDLKRYYHGPNSNFGMFSYSCARTCYNIEHPDEEPRAEICPRGMSQAVLDALEEVRPYGT